MQPVLSFGNRVHQSGQLGGDKFRQPAHGGFKISKQENITAEARRAQRQEFLIKENSELCVLSVSVVNSLLSVVAATPCAGAAPPLCPAFVSRFGAAGP